MQFIINLENGTIKQTPQKNSYTIAVSPQPTQVKIDPYNPDTHVIQRKVKATANTARVYVPKAWIGHDVKIIKL